MVAPDAVLWAEDGCFRIRPMAYDLGLAERMRIALSRRRAKFEERKMFGGLCFMVNERMCCGIVKTDMVLKLTPEMAEEALKKPHTRPMDFTGKPMRSMIYVDAVGSDKDERLEDWIDLALGVDAQPGKSSKKARKAAMK